MICFPHYTRDVVLSLKLAFPDVNDRTQIRNFFKYLWKNGLIALKSPWIGDYTIDSGDDDLDFLALGDFTVGLTNRGVVRWDRIRRYPAHANTHLSVTSAADALPNLIGRPLALAHTRKIGRDAIQAWDERVNTHGCTVRGTVHRAAGN